jgi:hypothetical protein
MIMSVKPIDRAPGAGFIHSFIHRVWGLNQHAERVVISLSLKYSAIKHILNHIGGGRQAHKRDLEEHKSMNRCKWRRWIKANAAA